MWHNRLALCLVPYFGYVKKRNQTPGMAALVSASKDGAFLAGILECFGVQPVRGSSSRRGPQALLELTGWAERGYDLAITPDGPRGPRYVVQEGASWRWRRSPASRSSQPHTTWAGRSGRRAGTGFKSRCPFSRCEMVLGKPVRVPREASDAEREALRQELERTLKEITRD